MAAKPAPGSPPIHTGKAHALLALAKRPAGGRPTRPLRRESHPHAMRSQNPGIPFRPVVRIAGGSRWSSALGAAAATAGHQFHQHHQLPRRKSGPSAADRLQRESPHPAGREPQQHADPRQFRAPASRLRWPAAGDERHRLRDPRAPAFPKYPDPRHNGYPERTGRVCSPIGPWAGFHQLASRSAARRQGPNPRQRESPHAEGQIHRAESSRHAAGARPSHWPSTGPSQQPGPSRHSPAGHAECAAARKWTFHRCARRRLRARVAPISREA